MLGSPMPIPGFYRFMGPANTLGVKPLPERDVPRISVEEVSEHLDAHVIDIRPRADQAAGVLEDSIAISLADDFGSWAGWLVPYGEPVILVANPDQDVAEAITQLHQIQFDNIVGIVNELDGAELTSGFGLVDLAEAKRLAEQGEAQLLDVRMESELEDVRYPGAVERFVADIYTQGIPGELDRDQPVLIACGSGRRAAIAASRLTAAGYDVHVLDDAGVADLAGEGD